MPVLCSLEWKALYKRGRPTWWGETGTPMSLGPHIFHPCLSDEGCTGSNNKITIVIITTIIINAGENSVSHTTLETPTHAPLPTHHFIKTHSPPLHPKPNTFCNSENSLSQESKFSCVFVASLFRGVRAHPVLPERYNHTVGFLPVCRVCCCCCRYVGRLTRGLRRLGLFLALVSCTTKKDRTTMAPRKANMGMVWPTSWLYRPGIMPRERTNTGPVGLGDGSRSRVEKGKEHWLQQTLLAL